MWPNLFAILLAVALCFPAAAQNLDSAVQKPGKANNLGKIIAAPAVLFGLGLSSKKTNHILNSSSVFKWRNERIPDFVDHTDEYVQYLPIAMVYAMDALGNKSKNDLVNRSLLLAKAELMMIVTVRILKNTVHELRPDGNDYRSFPSGHTSQAFVAATFLHREFGKKNIWYSITGYTMATSVAVWRVLNNRHWTSDVLVGAGIGILSTNIAYATHKYRWGKKTNMVILPTYSKGLGLFFSIKV